MDKLDKALFWKLRSFRDDVLNHLRDLDKYSAPETVEISKLREQIIDMDECYDLLEAWDQYSTEE